MTETLSFTDPKDETTITSTPEKLNNNFCDFLEKWKKMILKDKKETLLIQITKAVNFSTKKFQGFQAVYTSVI